VYWDPFEFPNWKNHQEAISFQRLSPSYPCDQPQPGNEGKVIDSTIVGATPPSGDKIGKSSMDDMGMDDRTYGGSKRDHAESSSELSSELLEVWLCRHFFR